MNWLKCYKVLGKARLACARQLSPAGFIAELRNMSYPPEYRRMSRLLWENVMHAVKSLLPVIVLLSLLLSSEAFAAVRPPVLDDTPVLTAAEANAPELAESAALETPATPGGEPAALFSPAIAQRFYQIAYQLAGGEKVASQDAQQAIVFLSAVLALDSGADYCYPLLIKLVCRHTPGDNSQLVTNLLADYVDASADRDVVKEAVRYLLDRLNSRERREALIEQLLRNFGNKNFIIGSDLAAQLGLLMAEKPDVEGAQFYLAQAYNNNEYNRAAFAKLTEIAPDKLPPAVYLRHLRILLRENQADLQAALDFAQYAERLELYDIAARGYEYCANLFTYLYPSQPIPSDIYLPWALSCYNTTLSQPKCIQIAENVRKSGRFDLLLEAIAGKAALKIGDAALAERIFQQAEAKSQQLLSRGPDRLKERPLVGAKEFAWFYCFVLPDPAKALDWANKAYSIDPNSPVTAAILAYALVENDQIEWAKPIISNIRPNQIAALALARIQLKEEQTDVAIETLKALVANDPGSLAAELAKDMLAKQGAQYSPPVDPAAVMAAMKTGFGEAVVPTFIAPDKLFSVQFSARGTKFSYGSMLDATVAIINNSSEPLVISDNSLFKGNIRIDADVTGDITKSIPNLVSLKARHAFLIEPGRSLLIPVQLVTGPLDHLLLAHPQASLDIVFTLYLDPVTADGGKVINGLVGLSPAKLSVNRPGIEVTGKYLRTRFNSISTGQVGQKIKTAQLFVGLLMEQQIMSGRRPPYKLVYADWMPPMLKSGLIHESGLLRNPVNGEWVVKVHTMVDMLYLSLDQELVSAVAENLNSQRWPVRLLAVYLLAKTQQGKFNKVLDWVAKDDPDAIVHNMAIALGGTAAEQTELSEEPLPQPPTIKKPAASTGPRK
jgi:hypothetical protein